MLPTYTPNRDQSQCYVHPRLASIIQQGEKQEWRDFCYFIRLNLQGRITSQSGDDIIKLQGRIEEIEELESFLIKIIEKPVK